MHWDCRIRRRARWPLGRTLFLSLSTCVLLSFDLFVCLSVCSSVHLPWPWTIAAEAVQEFLKKDFRKFSKNNYSVFRLELIVFGEIIHNFSRPLFPLILSFRHLTVTNVQYKSLPMTGVEPQISVVGCDHSANWTTTTAPISLLYSFISSQSQSMIFGKL